MAKARFPRGSQRELDEMTGRLAPAMILDAVLDEDILIGRWQIFYHLNNANENR